MANETPYKKVIRHAKALKDERSTWDQDWRDLIDFVKPRSGLFVTTDKNKGGRRGSKIVDSEATRALNTLTAGMMNGMTSPTRPWFDYMPEDPDLKKYGPAERWLYMAEQRTRDTLLRTNIYSVLPNTYRDAALFGVHACGWIRDGESVMRAYPFPIGSYSLACDKRNKVSTCAREYAFSVSNLVEEFGYDNVSERVQKLYRAGTYEQLVDVLWYVGPNHDYRPNALAAKYKRWKSCYIELGANDGEKYLRESGFDAFPILAPRWENEGGATYGTDCPGFTSLGDTKQLQATQRSKSVGIEKQGNPPVQGPAYLRDRDVSLLPGGVTFYESGSGGEGLRPVYEVQPDLSGIREDILENHDRIRSCYYADLFLMISDDRRNTPATAYEIASRNEEKLTMLGPVLDKLHEELLNPLVDMTFNALVESGELPPAPPELQGMPLKVKYTSILAQAARMVSVAGIDRFWGMIGAIAPLKPEILDKINPDQLADTYGESLGIPPAIINSNDDVAEVRQQRAQQQQQADTLAAAESASKSAKSLAEAAMGGDSALSRMVANVGGSPQ